MTQCQTFGDGSAARQDGPGGSPEASSPSSTPELAEPRFSTILGPKQNEDELDQLIGEYTRSFTPEQATALMQESGMLAEGVITTEYDAPFNSTW